MLTVLIYNLDNRRYTEPSTAYDNGEPPVIPRIWNPANRQLTLQDGGAFTTLDMMGVVPHNPIPTMRGPHNVTSGVMEPRWNDSMMVPSAQMGRAWESAFMGGKRV